MIYYNIDEAGSAMQNQDAMEKAFFDQIKPGDYVDARFSDDDWKVAKVVDRQNKYLSLLFDGLPPNNEQVYMSPMRVKPLRAVTVAYTGPVRSIYSSITPIAELVRFTQIFDSMLKSSEPASPYRITQFLRGEVFCNVNLLLMSDLKLSPDEIAMLNNFFIQLIDRIGKICVKVKFFLPDYFQANPNNKYAYLSSFKLALVWSLQQLLHLVCHILGQGQDMARLFKNYKNQILHQNMVTSIKQYLPTLVELASANDINGRWMPTFTRLQITKVLIKFKEEDKILSISYNVKDYLQYYSFWPTLLQLCPSEANEKKLIEYIHNVMCKQSPFDAKLKSLVLIRKILDKEQKLNMALSGVIQILNSKKIIDSLLKYFNPQIFKRYIPILKTISEQGKKTLTQGQVDDLFKIMKTSHESETQLIYEIIVSISEFINIDALDSIYTDIEKNIDINCEASIKFVRDFTIKAIQNFNTNKNKGFFNSLIGRKKNSSKYGYYGLDLLFKEMQDGSGKVQPKNVPFVISNIGNIFLNDFFHHERISYMQQCIGNIEKRESYGQSVKLLGQIINTYPVNAYIGDTQESVVNKLDDKHKLVDTLIKYLKPLEKQCKLSPLKNKVDFDLSIRYCYSFLQQFSSFFKHPLQLRHINHLWQMPHIFQFLRRSKEGLDSEIPIWKKKYYKKLSDQIIKGILMQVIKLEENIIPIEECFDAINQLIIAFNLNKSLQLTERATIRYKNLSSVVGISFYYKFLEKLVAVSRAEWKKKQGEPKNGSLIEKVIKAIFQFNLRPNDYFAYETKCENWMKCLLKVMRVLHNENIEICVSSIEQFFELIKGRQFKDISATGKLEILVSWDGKEKNIILPKNATILRLRNSIMEAYKIKWNFDMYNTSLKRDIKFAQEEDFSVFAMGLAIKGPTILIKRVQEKELFPLFQACEKFMNLVENEQQFYQMLFGLLQSENANNIHSRIWRIIQKVPVNRTMKQKIKNCKDFSKEKWQDFLLPKRMEQLQYSINIVLSLLTNSAWMEDFKRTQGSLAIEQLYLTMLGSNEPLSQKIQINISKIILKILENSSHSHQKKDDKQIKQSENVEEKEDLQDLEKICMKIMEFLERLLERRKKVADQQKQQNPSMECLNLMMKILISASIKKNCPPVELIISYFLHNKVLLHISDMILFEPKDNDTTFFTEDILQKITLNLNIQGAAKHQVLRQFAITYLQYPVLVKRKSTQNYFIYLIDSLHSMDKDQANQLFLKDQQLVSCIKSYVQQSLDCQFREGEVLQRIEPNQEMLHGCFKLLNQTYQYAAFDYDIEKIFKVLLGDYVLSQVNSKANIIKSVKAKVKSKKILYEIMKSMIYSNENILNIFVNRISPKLQTASWRRNVFSSWSLEQQKKQKKFYCGLENLAATCYINCLFQQLFMIKRFTDRFINIDSLAYKEVSETNEIYQLQKLLVLLKYGNKRSYTTRPFCQSFITYEGLPIDPTVQNDADEFFNALMQKVQTFLKSSGHHYILEDTFQGKLSNQLNCEGCPHSSQKVQSFMSIGLNIKNKKTLELALDGYVEGEILDGDNAYFCQICQKKVRTMKRLCIKQAPNILVIVLKRFTYNFDEMRKIKINDELKFPQELNIKKYTNEYHLGQQCQPDGWYDYTLRGAVIHSGTSEGGHYYSFIKEQAKSSGKEGDNKWYEFNDECIEEADYKRIEEDGFGGEEKDSEMKMEKHKSAYILFYEKKKLREKQENCKNTEELIQMEGQSFESQLSKMVKSENRNSDFLSVILDQLFIRLCQNVAMCGRDKAHHFIILYFHTVLLRDRNKEEYLSNIYRIILTLMATSAQLCRWFLSQVNENYVREFLIEAPKITKYLCLGLVFEAIKILTNQDLIQQKLSNRNGSQIIKHIESSAADHELKCRQEQMQTSSEVGEATNNQCISKFNEVQKVFNYQSKFNSETNEVVIKKVISCFVYCLKSKGMSPFAKVFTYLSSFTVYRSQLQSLHYPQRVMQIILPTSSCALSSVPYNPSESYLGKQSQICKQKQLETSYSFLIESLKQYPGYLARQQILNLLASAQSRTSVKSLIYLLAEGTSSSQQMLESVEIYKLRLLDDKYKREDIERFALMVRYYYLMAEARANKSQIQDEYTDTVVNQNLSQKNICIDSLAIVIKSNQTSYMLMELLLIQINKLAYKSPDFKLRWMDKVSANEGVCKALIYWLEQSRRPHFLQRCQQWKRKTSNLSFQEKDILISENQATQEKRTQWMFAKKQLKHRWEKERKNNTKVGKEEQKNSSKEKSQAEVQEINSDIQLADVSKEVVVGFRNFKVIDRLGILTKVQDEKGLHRWAILQRNDVETYFEF